MMNGGHGGDRGPGRHILDDHVLANGDSRERLALTSPSSAWLNIIVSGQVLESWIEGIGRVGGGCRGSDCDPRSAPARLTAFLPAPASPPPHAEAERDQGTTSADANVSNPMDRVESYTRKPRRTSSLFCTMNTTSAAIPAPDAMAPPLSGSSLSAAPPGRVLPLPHAHGSSHAIRPAAVPSRRIISALWVSSPLSRFTAAAMRARWVKACGKLPTCCPVGSIFSA